jgi:hypothetical protein
MLFDNTQRFELYQMEYTHLIVEGSGQSDEFAADAKYTDGKAMQISVRAEHQQIEGSGIGVCVTNPNKGSSCFYATYDKLNDSYVTNVKSYLPRLEPPVESLDLRVVDNYEDGYLG